jgi:hypothetical protein
MNIQKYSYCQYKNNGIIKLMKKKPYTILAWADQHEPYSHVDSFNFIFAVAEKYNPDRYVNVGDEYDQHAINFHEHHPDLMSDGAEIDALQTINKPWARAFPNLDILYSNHGQMAIRKSISGGLSTRRIRPISEILNTPKGWIWHEQLVIETGGSKILFSHQLKKNLLAASKDVGCCVVEAHYHSSVGIQYYYTKLGELKWAVSMPCLIDDTSAAFLYNKKDTSRPVLGCLIIQSGIPRIIPMRLTSNGRWDGVVL